MMRNINPSSANSHKHSIGDDLVALVALSAISPDRQAQSRLLHASISLIIKRSLCVSAAPRRCIFGPHPDPLWTAPSLHRDRYRGLRGLPDRNCARGLVLDERRLSKGGRELLKIVGVAADRVGVFEFGDGLLLSRSLPGSCALDGKGGGVAAEERSGVGESR